MKTMSQTTPPTVSSRDPTSTPPHQRPTKRKSQCEKEGKNSKRRCCSVYHPNTQTCSPCALWSQSGSDMRLQEFHPLKNSRHAGEEAHVLSQYASHAGINFNIEMGSCICLPCYKDYSRNSNKENNMMPRWAKVKQNYYISPKHCIYCCGDVCGCESVSHWGPDNWYGEDSLISWKKYLSLTGKVEYVIGDDVNHICRGHYPRIFRIKKSRMCPVCNSQNPLCWDLVCNLTNSLQHFCEAFSLEVGTVGFFDWVCNQCCLCYKNDSQLIETLQSDKASEDPIIALKSNTILQVLDTLSRDGIIFTKDVVVEFRASLHALNVHNADQYKLCDSLTKYISTLSKDRYKSYIQTGKYSLGKVIYDEQKFTEFSIPYIFKLKTEEWEKSKTHISLKKFQQLIRKQSNNFPTSFNYDFSKIISENFVEFNALFDNELVNIIDSITTSTHSSTGYSDLYKDVRATRIKMIISLLCFTMNPKCCFFQTVVGLLCYAYGLRDRGFELLNGIGCTSSIDHIRAHGSYWANRLYPIQELTVDRQWRVSIDNLNFHMKFSKSLPESSAGAKKMLNLITGQVSHRQATEIEPITAVPDLQELIHTSVSNSIHNSISPITRNSITPQHFKTGLGTPQNYYLEQFVQVCYLCTVNRLTLPPVEHNKTFMETVQPYMPHWTPPCKDKVVYATVAEALSSSMVDVESYLIKLKKDLHIGEAGFPTKVLIAGDQQVYALLKDLQRKHPVHYSWMECVHGDWHTLQLVAEIIRDMLWDGGLKQLSFECGHKKIPTQWQDVHMLIVSLYESILRKALLEYSTIAEPNLSEFGNFMKWLHGAGLEHNKNEISKFWASVIPYLNAYIGYYFAIRSGNWLLRNSCLRALLPLIFAYNHNKYEDLCTTVLMDTLALSSDLMKWCLNGNWTVSVKGKPYHNIALDEAHESIINLRLKTITSRPSHFRTSILLGIIVSELTVGTDVGHPNCLLVLDMCPNHLDPQ